VKPCEVVAIDNRLGVAGEESRFSYEFRTVCVVEKHVAGAQPVTLSLLGIARHADELIPHNIAARVNVVHPELDNALGFPFAASKSGQCLGHNFPQPDPPPGFGEGVGGIWDWRFKISDLRFKI